MDASIPWRGWLAPLRVATASACLAAAACGGGSGGGQGASVPVTMTLSATVVGPTAINLSWTAAKTPPTRYEVHQDGTYLGPTNGTAVPVTGLSPGTRYCFVIYAIYFPVGAMERSNERCETTPADRPPTAPTGVSAATSSPARIDLAWTAAADDSGIASYRIHRDNALLATVTGLSYSDLAASPASTHCYAITAVDLAGNVSPPSASACATTPGDAEPPSTPSGLAASAVEATVTLTWDASTDNGAVASYQVQRDGVVVQSVPAPAGVASLTATDTGLGTYTQYCYRVVAIDRANLASGPSNRACTTTSWERTVILTAPALRDALGVRNALAIDAAGKLRIAYTMEPWLYDLRYAGPAELRVADNTSGGWSTQPVAPAIAPGSSGVGIALDAAGGVHVAFVEGGSVFPVHAQSANAWQPERISTDFAYGVSLALGDDDVPRLVYGQPDGLRFASRAGGSWTVAVVPGVGEANEPVLTLDGLGKPQVVMKGFSTQSLRHATDSGATWTTEVIEPSNPGGWHSVAAALDGGGAMHVVYLDGTGLDLKYATNESGAWQTTVLDSEGYVGLGASLALDAAGAVHVAYLDVENRRLKYATNATGTWRSYELDHAGAGQGSAGETSIGIDRGGRIHIVYPWANTLRHATRP